MLSWLMSEPRKTASKQHAGVNTAVSTSEAGPAPRGDQVRPEGPELADHQECQSEAAPPTEAVNSFQRNVGPVATLPVIHPPGDAAPVTAQEGNRDQESDTPAAAGDINWAAVPGQEPHADPTSGANASLEGSLPRKKIVVPTGKRLRTTRVGSRTTPGGRTEEESSASPSVRRSKRKAATQPTLRRTEDRP